MYGQTKFGTKYMKAPGLQFKRHVKEEVETNYPNHKTFVNPVAFFVSFYLPDKRKRDSSNVLKILEDALTEAGIWEDDSLIHLHILQKVGHLEGGCVVIEVEELE
jgi:Holliday junction resolvase RusA-like endonuclease